MLDVSNNESINDSNLMSSRHADTALLHGVPTSTDMFANSELHANLPSTSHSNNHELNINQHAVLVNSSSTETSGEI